MAQLTFAKATKSAAKARVALFGPSGAGKTFSALRIASGLGGPIAVIDTERGSASKYADRFSFDVLELPQKDIGTYVEGIHAAAKAGYQVLVIDSLSHAWQELLQEIDQLANAKYHGNTWSAWSEGTPKQRALVDAILDFPGHVLATMRSKTEWQTATDDRGKARPVRVGLAPEQGKGIEYEFDLLLELSPEHMAHIIKDRSGRFQDQVVEKPGEEFGGQLAAWLSDAPAAPVAAPAPPPAAPKNGTRAKAPEPALPPAPAPVAEKPAPFAEEAPAAPTVETLCVTPGCDSAIPPAHLAECQRRGWPEKCPACTLADQRTAKLKELLQQLANGDDAARAAATKAIEERTQKWGKPAFEAILNRAEAEIEAAA